MLAQTSETISLLIMPAVKAAASIAIRATMRTERVWASLVNPFIRASFVGNGPSLLLTLAKKNPVEILLNKQNPTLNMEKGHAHKFKSKHIS